MFRLKLNTKGNELIIQLSSNGIIEGYTTDTINKKYTYEVTVPKNEFNWHLKRCENVNKNFLVDII